MKYIDLFGGIGGFSYGIKQATKDWECVWYCDQDKYSVQTYNKNFGTKYEPTDISSIRTKDIPDHDIICAGFPCQSFSVAGKRRGFEDVRGTMFFEIMRIAKAKRTKYLFLENVKGLLNHDKGKTFTTIIQTLEELGYNTQWMVLNSKFFGVPQNRERVFIIGSLRGESRPEILPFGEDAKEIPGVSQDKGVEKGKEEKIMFDMYNKNMRAECPTLLEPHHNSIALWQMRVGHTKSEYSPNQYKSNVTRTLEASGNLSVLDKKITHKQIKGLGQSGKIYDKKGVVDTMVASMGTGGNNVPMVDDKSIILHRTKEWREHQGSPTLSSAMGEGGGNVPMVQGLLPITAKKRKFKTPSKINQFLKDNKKEFTLKEIAKKLDITKTQVEHYFRTDRYRAIPAPEVWMRLKQLLKFNDTYDKEVTEIYEKEVEYEMQRRVYSNQGLSPTIKTDVPMINAKESPTLTTELAHTSGNFTKNWIKKGFLRRLTPIECERLQGFPDNWTEGVSDTQRYKQCGNAVTTNVITAIVRSWQGGQGCPVGSTYLL